MQFKHKIRLFLNDPIFKRHRIDSFKSNQSKQLLYRNIFPSKLQIQRFKHLEQARINTIEDQHLGNNVQYAILKLQNALGNYHDKNQNLQKKKQLFFGKLKMDYVQQEMNQNMHQFQKLITTHQSLKQRISQEKSFIEKSLKMTEIKKALIVQNQMLKAENLKLKSQQKKVDNLIAFMIK